jgi:beta-lactamase regulating signal transducer with metallopeptidase domain
MIMYAGFTLFRWEVLRSWFDMCNSWFFKWGMPFMAILLDALTWTTVMAGIVMLGIQMYSYLRVKRNFAPLRRKDQEQAIAQAYRLPRRRLVIIEQEQAVALTMGFIRPVIVLSTGLINMLEEQELEAVIRHEEYHMQHHDALRAMPAYLLSKMMWYLPILRWCHHVLKISAEVEADRYAVARTGSAVGLGSALLKLARHKPPVPMNLSHVSFADTPINIRIRQLIDPAEKPRMRLPLLSTLISLPVAAVLASLLLPAMM